jgi:transcriptional regulator GlxA family with amidase domain
MSPVNAGILIFDDAEELDFAGPWEVLGTWGARLRLLGESTRPVRCRKGLTVVPDAPFLDTGGLDLVIVPGGEGTRPLMARQDVHRWLRGQAQRGALVASVCTGALVLAAAGMLDGRRATTHWSAYDELRAAGKDIEVDEHARFVDEGDVITAAGVSAGIDMALHLVARLDSPERARAVKREIQYECPTTTKSSRGYEPEPPV